MEKNIFFLLLVILVAVFHIVPATGHKQTSSELTASKKHNLKIKNKSSRHHQTKQMHYDPKCWPQRCNIICPIQVQPMPGYQNVPNAQTAPGQPPIPTPAPILTPSQAPIQTAAQASVPTSRTPADTFPINPATPTTGSTVPNRTAPGGAVPQLTNGLNNLNHYLDRGLKVLIGNLQHMTKRQKHILTKHYVLGTRSGKKAYQFRQQFAPFGCYVQCEPSQQNYPYPVQQILPGAPSNGGIEQLPVGTGGGAGGGDGGEDEGEDEEEVDEPYHEGEDKPIEVTAAPPDRRQYSLGNDFLTMEDYGEPFYFEDKKKKSRSHYRHHKN